MKSEGGAAVVPAKRPYRWRTTSWRGPIDRERFRKPRPCELTSRSAMNWALFLSGKRKPCGRGASLYAGTSDEVMTCLAGYE